MVRSARHRAWTLPLPSLDWRPCLAMRGDSQPKAEAALTPPAHGPMSFTLRGLEASRGRSNTCARAGGWEGMSFRRVRRQGPCRELEQAHLTALGRGQESR